MMFNRGIAPFPFLWTELRTFLTDRIVTLERTPVHRKFFKIADIVYRDEEVHDMAMELAQRIFSGTIFKDGTTFNSKKISARITA